MRKELLVYITTAERDEELSVSSISKNRSCVILNSGGTKFTANRKELIDALNAIEAFDNDNDNTVKGEVVAPATPDYQDFEFVQGDDS